MVADVFNRVEVDIALNAPPIFINPTNQVAMATDFATPFTGVILAIPYDNFADFEADFPIGTRPKEHAFGVAYFNVVGGSTRLIAIKTPVVTATGDLSTAINAADEYAFINDIGRFFGVGFGDFDAIMAGFSFSAEMTLLDAFGIKYAVVPATADSLVFAQTAGNAFLNTKALNLKDRVTATFVGEPLLEAPAAAVGRADSYNFSRLAAISLANIGQLQLDNTVLQGIQPLVVDSIESGPGVTFTKTVISDLIDSQLNLYFKYGSKTQFAFGLIANGEFNIPLVDVYVRQFLESSLTEALDNVLQNEKIPYDDVGITRGKDIIVGVLKDFVAAGAIDPIYTLIPPTLIVPAPIPNTLGPYDIQLSINQKVYFITVTGSAEV